MSTVYSLPYDITRYFEYKELDKIHGQPNIDTIIKLVKQLKRNAQWVPTILGGGQLGYLALILSDTDYLKIPNSSAFIRPSDPGTFSPGTTGTVTRASTTTPLTPTEIATEKLHSITKRSCIMNVKQLKLHCGIKS